MSTPSGERIRFIRGTYVGKTGWINNSKKETAKMVYVIVELEDGLKETRVAHASIARPAAEPTSYGEATLQQHPDIDGMMDKLVCQLAKCHMSTQASAVNSAFKTTEIFCNKLFQAIATQQALGDKATWRHVHYEEEDSNLEDS
jgi:hypothetical protein